ncbi:RagB/SusD family nutrient uptake outer membrane protein [Niastella caeni]|uniref:RagB/SusD family nutrient uptake outer membrane protein n=1 Tax=Niastella caeni TaxID=2569763 RepID=A0A4S8I0Y3_9BACT|nr:RagB/SusD family nutrient uptake outer membrane protein [Niastella caeni]THU39322.1 RagB/SusD family nutrient uptake outer membrane protein [Niastella caeni]
MKCLKYIFTVMVLNAIMPSCKKDFLTVPNKNVILRQAYVVDLKTTGDYLNGVYTRLPAFFDWGGINYPEMVADNIKPMTGLGLLEPYYLWSQQANDSRGRSFDIMGVNANGGWIVGINIAQACSFVLENVDKYKEQNPQLADNFKGQAYALRALVHFAMVNIFAQSYFFTPDASHPGIPYVNSSDWAEPATRASVAKVYEQIIADLNNAITLLPVQQSAPEDFKHSLFGKFAAKALLARVHLFKGDWMVSKNLAVEVASAVPVMSINEGYPSRLFTNSETEALFQLPPSDRSVSKSAGTYFTAFSATLYGGDYHVLFATNDIASIIKENPLDARNSWVQRSGSDWNIKKFPKNVIPGFPQPEGSYFQTLLRSSEMYLTVAEASAKLGDEVTARAYLDNIRQRALPTGAPTTATGSALLDSIYKERRKELAFEGIRMFDIQRLKQAVKRVDAPLSVQNLPFGSNKAIAPIPTSDVEKGGMPQNPGY